MTLTCQVVLSKMVATNTCYIFVIVLCFHYVSATELYVDWNPTTQSFSFNSKETENFAAYGNFNNAINQTGWAYLEITTNGSQPNEVQAYAAGLAEGQLTKQLIQYAWMNTMAGYCTQPYNSYCTRLEAFLRTNLNWMNQKIQMNEDPYWHQIALYLVQINGLTDGYNNAPGKVSTEIANLFGLYMFQVGGDMEDLEEVLKKEGRKRVKGSGSCSAFIKLLKGNSDLYAAQDTWTSYQQMLRILKTYTLNYKTSSISPETVYGNSMTFSSYPGFLSSGDDYYLLSTNMLSLETTIGNSNADLWKYVQADNIVLEAARSVVANRLSNTGAMWANIFSRFNSGTYNNEWIIVDYKQFTAGSPTQGPGLLTVLDQIPGHIHFDDVTDKFVNQTYWASYNAPYFKDIFNLSGDAAAEKQFGDWFSYDHTPRANIFRRDQGKVVDLQSFLKLMRYNDYQHDPLSKCNCTPPYSAENAISARSDLNPKNGTYPFGALGHRLHGGMDAKLTNSSMLLSQTMVTISSPTYDQQPPFQWSKSDFNHLSHVGQPDLWNFRPIIFNGTNVEDVKPFI